MAETNESSGGSSGSKERVALDLFFYIQQQEGALRAKGEADILARYRKCLRTVQGHVV